MTRRVFFSFQYTTDIWRVQNIRNMNVVGKEDAIFYDHADLEKIFKQDKKAVEKWIDDQLKGCSCIVVLIGSSTADSEWVMHEIKRGYQLGKAMLGIHINNIQDQHKNTTSLGINPFSKLHVNNVTLDKMYNVYTPSSQDPYNDIKRNISSWIEVACKKAGI